MVKNILLILRNATGEDLMFQQEKTLLTADQKCSSFLSIQSLNDAIVCSIDGKVRLANGDNFIETLHNPIDLMTTCSWKCWFACYSPSKEYSICIYQLKEQEVNFIKAIKLPQIDKVECMTFVENGTKLAVGTSTGACYLIDVEQECILATLLGHSKCVRSIAVDNYTTSQLLLTCGDDGLICMHDLHSYTIAQLFGPVREGSVIKVKWNPTNSSYFCSVDTTGTVRYWDSRTGAILNSWEGSKSINTCTLASISPSGNRICIVYPGDRSMHIYRIINS